MKTIINTIGTIITTLVIIAMIGLAVIAINDWRTTEWSTQIDSIGFDLQHGVTVHAHEYKDLSNTTTGHILEAVKTTYEDVSETIDGLIH